MGNPHLRQAAEVVAAAIPQREGDGAQHAAPRPRDEIQLRRPETGTAWLRRTQTATARRLRLLLPITIHSIHYSIHHLIHYLIHLIDQFNPFNRDRFNWLW